MSGTKIQSNSLPRRLTAALGVALVLMLNVLALRPDWHEALCHHEQASKACAHTHQTGSQHHEQGDSDDATNSV
jgi:hypothetical protein